MIYIYYRKSIDKMILVNTEPSDEWKKYSRDHTCELYLEEPIIFDQAIGTITPDQDLVKWALKIDDRD